MKKLSILLFCSLISLFANAQLLYKVSGNGIEKPSYMFGTHHMVPMSIMDSVPALFDVVKQVDCVIGEVDMSEGMLAMAMKLQPMMMAPADSTLSKVLSEDDYALVDSAFNNAMGFSVKMMDMMKPAAIQNMLLVPLIQETMPDFSADSQIDMKLQEIVKENGGEIYGFETVEDQAYALFGAKSIARQAEDLLEFIANPQKGVEESAELTEAYMNRDMDRLLELSSGITEDAVAYDELLIKRNARWMEKLPDMINAKPCLIVVGALHLIGDYGLIKQLRELGYTVEPVR